MSKTETVGRYTYSTDWTSRNADSWRQVLGSLAGKPGIRALEVGTYEGRSAVWLLENILTGAQASITCIDIFNGAYELNFDRNVKPYGAQVEKIKARSQVALRGLKPESYDFAYIDGSHVAKDVLVDAMLTWDLVKPDGLIIFDDYEWTGKEGQAFTPKIAIDAFLDVMEPYVDIVHKGEQLVVKKRMEPRVAAGLSRFGNRGRETLSYVAISGEALYAAFHLPLPELPARFPSRAQDQTHSRLSGLLPRA